MKPAWNKGTKGVMKANKTSFKKGNPAPLTAFKKGQASWNKGKKLPFHSKEANEKQSNRYTGQGNPFFGKKHTIETKKKTTGENNWHWKGDDVGYAGVHKWVKRYLGTPSICEKCGTETAKKYEWANIDHKYRRVLDDYIRLCTSCHRIHDQQLTN